MQVRAMTRAEDAVLLRSLLLNGRQFFENGRDAAFLFLDLDLRVAHLDAFANAFGRVVPAHVLVGATALLFRIVGQVDTSRDAWFVMRGDLLRVHGKNVIVVSGRVVEPGGRKVERYERRRWSLAAWIVPSKGSMPGSAKVPGKSERMEALKLVTSSSNRRWFRWPDDGEGFTSSYARMENLFMQGHEKDEEEDHLAY